MNIFWWRKKKVHKIYVEDLSLAEKAMVIEEIRQRMVDRVLNHSLDKANHLWDKMTERTDILMEGDTVECTYMFDISGRTFCKIVERAKRHNKWFRKGGLVENKDVSLEIERK